MNFEVNAKLKVLTALLSLVAASHASHASAVVLLADSSGLVRAAFRPGHATHPKDPRIAGQGAASEGAELYLAPRVSLADGFSPLGSDAPALDDHVLDGELGVPGSRYAIRLYPIGNGSGGFGAAVPIRESTPSVRARRNAQDDPPSAAKAILIPEPGNWAMVLAGLLGVIAIARRRMSL
jgi:hypothetical protein